MNNLKEIPFQKYCPAENMAIDTLMLESAGAEEAAFWRFYSWSEPAFTFGYSQKWAWVENQLTDFSGTAIRRTTGGGVVDHRDDLTYALSIPSVHPFHRQEASSLYRTLHQSLAEILLTLGFPAVLQPCDRSSRDLPPPARGICFLAPEPYDVVHPVSGLKIAGAAMKRTRSGLLVQGSLSRQALPGLQLQLLQSAFRDKLSEWLQLPSSRLAEPFPDTRIKSLASGFSRPQWNQRR